VGWSLNLDVRCCFTMLKARRGRGSRSRSLRAVDALGVESSLRSLHGNRRAEVLASRSQNKGRYTCWAARNPAETGRAIYSIVSHIIRM